MHASAGALRADRLWGTALLVSLLALIGVAPFSIFMSEYQLLRAAVGAAPGSRWCCSLPAGGVVFVAALRHLIDMAFGTPAVTASADARRQTGFPDRCGDTGLLLLLGMWMPLSLVSGIASAAALLPVGRDDFAATRNAVPLPAARFPSSKSDRFVGEVLSAIADGGVCCCSPVCRETARERGFWPPSPTMRVARSRLCSTVVGGAYPSLTPDCPAAHHFEREIQEQWGVHPEGHPWLKPVRFPPGGPTIGESRFLQGCRRGNP